MERTTKNENSTKRELQRAANFIRLLRVLSAEMQMQQAEILIQIAINYEGMQMSDIAKKTSLSPGAVSRNVASLSVYNRPDKPGMGLVEVGIDPVDPRRRIASLSQQGKVFITNLMRTIEPSFTIDSVTDAEVEAQARTLRAAIQDGATVGKIKR